MSLKLLSFKISLFHMVRIAFFEKSELFQTSWPLSMGTPPVHVRHVDKNLFQMVNNVTIKELFWKSINLNTLK